MRAKANVRVFSHTELLKLQDQIDAYTKLGYRMVGPVQVAFRRETAEYMPAVVHVATMECPV